jgi:hypothetical protein
MSGKAIPLGLVIDFKREKETFGSMGVNYKVLGIMAYNTESKELENIVTKNLSRKCFSIVQGSFESYYIDECETITYTPTGTKLNFRGCPLFSTRGELITSGAKSSINRIDLGYAMSLYVDIENLSFNLGSKNVSAVSSLLMPNCHNQARNLILSLTDSEVQGVNIMGDTLVVTSEFKWESLVVPTGIKNIVFYYAKGNLKEVVFNKEFETIYVVGSSDYYRNIEKIFLSRDTTEEQLATIIYSFEYATDIDKLPSIAPPHFYRTNEYLQFARENSEFARAVIGSLSVCIY